MIHTISLKLKSVKAPDEFHQGPYKLILGTPTNRGRGHLLVNCVQMREQKNDEKGYACLG